MKMVLSSTAAAVILTFGLVLPHDMMAVSLASVIIGLGLLAIGAKGRPAGALSIWGVVFVPSDQSFTALARHLSYGVRQGYIVPKEAGDHCIHESVGVQAIFIHLESGQLHQDT